MAICLGIYPIFRQTHIRLAIHQLDLKPSYIQSHETLMNSSRYCGPHPQQVLELHRSRQERPSVINHQSSSINYHPWSSIISHGTLKLFLTVMDDQWMIIISSVSTISSIISQVIHHQSLIIRWQCVKTLYPCSSPQNSWDLWMCIPLKMVSIGIDPYPYFKASKPSHFVTPSSFPQHRGCLQWDTCQQPEGRWWRRILTVRANGPQGPNGYGHLEKETQIQGG